jgi:hypothetical protein
MISISCFIVFMLAVFKDGNGGLGNGKRAGKVLGYYGVIVLKVRLNCQRSMELRNWFAIVAQAVRKYINAVVNYRRRVGGVSR